MPRPVRTAFRGDDFGARLAADRAAECTFGFPGVRRRGACLGPAPLFPGQVRPHDLELVRLVDVHADFREG